MASPSLGSLTTIFLRIGNLTFGGGDPTMAALQRELVESRRWLSSGQYGLCWSLARVTPGTNVLAFCAASAWLLRGWPGALLAALAASLPSAVLAVWILLAWNATAANPWVARAVVGVSAAVVGMMVAAALLLIKPHFRFAPIAAASLVLSYGFGLSPILILALAALAGYFWLEP